MLHTSSECQIDRREGGDRRSSPLPFLSFFLSLSFKSHTTHITYTSIYTNTHTTHTFMPSTDTSISHSLWSRTVYVVAFVWLLLLWLLVWSWRDDGIVPTSERESDGPTNVIAPIEPLITIPEDMGTLCTSDTYNAGQWVRREKLLQADKPSDIEKVAGYHCSGGFPHKCYRRLNEGNEFNRSKHM